MTSFKFQVLPDGSRCYSGPNCRRHFGNVADSVLGQLKHAQVKVEQIKAGLFPKGSKRLGLNTDDPDWASEWYDLSREIESGFDVTEKNAIKGYAMGSYISVNALLRKGWDGMADAVRKDLNGSRVSDETITEYGNRAESIINSLDRIFKRNEVAFNEPVVVYRAIHVSNVQDGETVLDSVKRTHKIGDVLEDKGFVSTSLDSDYMTFFGRKRNKERYGHPVVYEILAKRGLPVLEESFGEQPARVESGSIQSFEREVLLNRGSKFKVVGVKQVTFQHSYTSDTLRSNHSDLPKRLTVPVVQVVQI